MDYLPWINKLYYLVAQEETNCNSSHVTDDHILANAYETKNSYGRGRGMNHGKNNSRYCTYCHTYGNIVEFCYQNHGHYNINKPISSANSYNNNDNDSY